MDSVLLKSILSIVFDMVVPDGLIKNLVAMFCECHDRYVYYSANIENNFQITNDLSFFSTSYFFHPINLQQITVEMICFCSLRMHM